MRLIVFLADIKAPFTAADLETHSLISYFISFNFIIIYHYLLFNASFDYYYYFYEVVAAIRRGPIGLWDSERHFIFKGNIDLANTMPLQVWSLIIYLILPSGFIPSISLPPDFILF